MTTGISARERARTLNALADSDTRASDFVRPGHIFPLKYRPGGVLVRSGHTEAALDLCRLAGRAPAAALCELVNDDGTMQRMPQLTQFARQHEIPIISIAALIEYRAHHDVLVQDTGRSEITLHGQQLTVYAYRTAFDKREITALVKGPIDGREPTLVRVVKGARGRDLLGSALSPGNVISRSLELLLAALRSVLIYFGRRALTTKRPKAPCGARSAWAAGAWTPTISGWRASAYASSSQTSRSRSPRASTCNSALGLLAPRPPDPSFSVRVLSACRRASRAVR